MKVKRTKSGSVKINVDMLYQIKSYCKPRGISLGHFMNEAAAEKLVREINKSVTPQDTN